MKRGFTLPEILITVAIIGMLSTIVVASTNKNKKSADNASALSNIRNYELALSNYAQENDGKYPSPGPAGQLYCLGGTTCIVKGITLANSSILDSALAPYVGDGSHLPAISNLSMKIGGAVYQGNFYRCMGVGDPCDNPTSAILYFIEPGNGTCVYGRPAIFADFPRSYISFGFSPTNGENTICIVNTNQL